MGAWPEFQQCCGLVPLRTGTILIGILSLIIHFAHISVYIHQVFLVNQGNSYEDDESFMILFDSFIITLFIVVNVCEFIIGIVLLLSLNKPHILKKVVSYMTVMWLLNLVMSLVNASRESYSQAYLVVTEMLINAYFILVIRSYHMELEGRLERDDTNYSRPSSISENFMALFRHAPPPNYDEAMRSNHQIVTTDTICTTENPERVNETGGVNNEAYIGTNTETNNDQNNRNNETNDEINDELNEVKVNTAVLKVTEQVTITDRRLSMQFSTDEQVQINNRSENTRRVSS